MNVTMFKLAKSMLLLLCLIMASTEIWGQNLTVVAVGDASLDKERLLFLEQSDLASMNDEQKKMAKEFLELVRNDFSFYRAKFEIISRLDGKGASFGRPDYLSLKGETIDYVIFIRVFKETNIKAISVELKGYRVSDQSAMFASKDQLLAGDLRPKGHDITDRLYREITGKDSIFKSFIVFVSDLISKQAMALKELYIMDFDGHNKQRLTRHNGMVISPAISPDNRYILYSMVKDKASKNRNIDLYIYDRQARSSRVISSRKGINSGAVFMPDKQHIALTLTHSDNAEIYMMNMRTGALRRVTQHFAIDVDPSVNRDGSLMAFLSNRAGEAHIYTMDPRGVEKDVVRVSFVGQFNATPRFSPDGQQIAFASWMEGRFDIFRVDSDRKNLVRLTKDFGSNEDPTWSNDGQFIAFSSQRVISQQKAEHNVYIMDRDGEIIGPITKDFGNCITPSWSN